MALGVAVRLADCSWGWRISAAVYNGNPYPYAVSGC